MNATVPAAEYAKLLIDYHDMEEAFIFEASTTIKSDRDELRDHVDKLARENLGIPFSEVTSRF